MRRSIVIALTVSLLMGAAPVMADRGPPRDASVAALLSATGIQIAESAAQCRAKCERLRTGCSGSQCRAAYAACIASCR